MFVLLCILGHNCDPISICRVQVRGVNIIESDMQLSQYKAFVSFRQYMQIITNDIDKTNKFFNLHV